MIMTQDGTVFEYEADEYEIVQRSDTQFYDRLAGKHLVAGRTVRGIKVGRHAHLRPWLCALAAAMVAFVVLWVVVAIDTQ
jgi:hypothetical protein